MATPDFPPIRNPLFLNGQQENCVQEIPFCHTKPPDAQYIGLRSTLQPGKHGVHTYNAKHRTSRDGPACARSVSITRSFYMHKNVRQVEAQSLILRTSYPDKASQAGGRPHTGSELDKKNKKMLDQPGLFLINQFDQADHCGYKNLSHSKVFSPKTVTFRGP